MNFDELMPPDPFAQDGIDEMELEAAERLAHDDASGSDPRWDRLDGPTTDQFDDAAEELRELEVAADEQVGSLMWRTALAGIAVLVAIGLVLLLVR
ncbi:MAG: hypothetical protein Q8K89_01595 [Actinomycetota bacterium]|nr:hypothetical protein [Actinomycetota bacterium]